MIILEENFKWHLEAFASELFIYYIQHYKHYNVVLFFFSHTVIFYFLGELSIILSLSMIHIVAFLYCDML